MTKLKLGQRVVYKTKRNDEWQFGRICKIVNTEFLTEKQETWKVTDFYDRTDQYMTTVFSVKDFIKKYKTDISEIIKSFNARIEKE